jgi:hypothetical protein
LGMAPQLPDQIVYGLALLVGLHQLAGSLKLVDHLKPRLVGASPDPRLGARGKPAAREAVVTASVRSAELASQRRPVVGHMSGSTVPIPPR